MSQALRKLTGVVSRNQSIVLFINQIRMKIGVVFGNPETTTGGNALKFYSSVRLDIRRIGQVKDGDVVIGSRTRVKVVKNKLAPPFREAEFDIRYGVGVDRWAEALDLAVERGVLEKSGAWFSLDGERIGQGREKAAEWLRTHPDQYDRLVARLRAAPQTEPSPVAAPAREAAGGDEEELALAAAS
jgi:recombination protein RecA